MVRGRDRVKVKGHTSVERELVCSFISASCVLQRRARGVRKGEDAPLPQQSGARRPGCLFWRQEKLMPENKGRASSRKEESPQGIPQQEDEAEYANQQQELYSSEAGTPGTAAGSRDEEVERI
ncbi:hypothetical protein NDU88_004949 [Pleurodeles waltl]|uniref:Uncharacterized protein n=1 Tax=Pleurodeles waltl TaxID=8319 RepID=A0AAV7NTX6_PLEWA|nr:hypothetical protein NDU88_004949 [Pleurodeles waltl]